MTRWRALGLFLFTTTTWGACKGSSPSTDGPTSAGDGAAGSSGACTVARAANPVLPGPRTPALLATAGAIVGSCLSDDGINRNVADMWASDINHSSFHTRAVLQAECLASAKCGCDALNDCLGVHAVFGTANEFPESSQCSGSTFKTCGGLGATTSYCLSADCAAVGLTCESSASCIEGPATACDAATFVPGCDTSGRPQLCADGVVIRGADCAVIGSTCNKGKCVGPGAACAGGDPDGDGLQLPAGLACVGANLDSCVGGSHATIDCSKRGPGFSCQTFGGHSFCGLASQCLPGNEPLAVDDGEVKCVGDSVVFCSAGRVETVDCLSLGFQGCEVKTSVGRYGCYPSIGP